MAKILLVEDDNNLREIYDARLQAEGYTIVAANDGEQALVVAKNERPDLVISDVMMPKISGFEMLDILRNTDGLKDVKVIMLTALGQSEDKTRADQLGANKYLVKSQVTLEDIVKTAHQLLDDEIPATTEVAEPATPLAVREPVATPLSTVPDPIPATPPTAVPVVPDPPTASMIADDATAPPAALVDATPPATTPQPIVAPVQAMPAPPTAPAVLPDPVTVDPRTDADTANDPLSVAEETAAMQAQISTFEAAPAEVPAAVIPEPVVAPETVEPAVVQPATETTMPTTIETTAPATPSPVVMAPLTSTPEPAAPTGQIVIPEAMSADVATSNDTVIANAVDSLSPPNLDTSQKPSDVTAVEVPPETTSVSAATPPAAADQTAKPSEDDGLNMHKKINIRPLSESPDKKDINQLLAEEMAKSNPGGTATDSPSIVPAQGVTPPSSDGSADDPTSVAL